MTETLVRVLVIEQHLDLLNDVSPSMLEEAQQVSSEDKE
ncbi:MAG: hypothetical protein ACJAZY_000307 [Spirosomataceae bacterium]